MTSIDETDNIMEPNPDLEKDGMITTQDLLMHSVTQFFKVKKNIEVMLPIIQGKSVISLRVIDWFVTNFSKKNNIYYNLKGKDGNIRPFFVYLDYKQQLKGFSKKKFDPFCRRERIEFIDHAGNKIETTVGQLNFFKWAIQKGIIKYIEKNLVEIEGDMNESIRQVYKKKAPPTTVDGAVVVETPPIEEAKIRRKRQELSVSATKSVCKHQVKIIVDFN
jgi:hypothetical protein